MKISPQTVVSDYQSLRQAATAGKSEADISINAQPVELMTRNVDNDPATPDTIVVSAWNGDFSAPAATLSFQERLENGKQVLEFTAEQGTSLFDPDRDTSKALIDLATGELIRSEGVGNFLVSNAGQVAPPALTAEQLEQNEIRSSYRELSEQASTGEKEFAAGVGSVTVQEYRPGYLQVQTWDGGFSSGRATETFREYQQDGRTMLEYTKLIPGSPFMVGSEDQKIVRNFPL
jgi:hypothetical protein